jgi:hypothetical protein
VLSDDGLTQLEKTQANQSDEVRHETKQNDLDRALRDVFTRRIALSSRKESGYLPELICVRKCNVISSSSVLALIESKSTT